MRAQDNSKYIPKRNNDYNQLEEIIKQDKKLKYIYDDNVFILKVDDIEYKLSSQIIKKVRDLSNLKVSMLPTHPKSLDL